MIRRPGLLNASLTEIARLEPTAASVTAKMVGAGEATLTLAEDAPAVHVHDWVSMYTRAGFAGYYRVTNVAQTYRKQIDVSLLFGIDILSDSVWPEQTEFSGTKAQFLTQLLDKQTQLINGVKPWQLGTCADTSSIDRSINYDRLSTLLEALEVEGSNYYFTYDQTTWPWTINYVAKTNTVSSEFRLTRNVRTATITYNDADLCTRLYLSVSSKNEDTVTVKKKNPLYIDDETTPGVPALVDDNITVSYTDSAVRTYNNNAAQAVWGIVTKTADIDTKDDIAEQHFASADAWAANYLALRAEPSVQIQIDGDTLREITGSSWDETSIGALCQVALPDYGHTFREYVVSITYPDLVRDETHVTVSLANTLPKVSESIATARAEAATAARSSRANARAAADAKEITHWSQVVKYQGDALDGSGILTLYESGIDMDATGGVVIHSLQQGLRGLYSEIKVNAEEIYEQSQKISLIIMSDNSLNVGSIVGGINEQTGQSIWRISADMIELNAGTVLATTLDARLANVDDLFTTNGYSGTITAGVVQVITGLDIYSIGSDTYKRYSPKSIYIGSTLQDMEFLGNGSTASFTISDPVTGFGTATSDATTGEVTIPFYTHNYPSSAPNTGNKINFNIANMAYFQNHVGISSLIVDVTDQAGYNDSSADPISVAADGYYIIAAAPNYGTTAYKKFHVPAGTTTTPKVSKGTWSGGQIMVSASSAASDPVSATIKIKGGTQTGNLDSATNPTKISFDVLEDIGSNQTADTGVDIEAAVARGAATLKISAFDATNNKFVVSADTVGYVTVGGQRIQVGVTQKDLPVVKGTATPGTPQHAGNGVYTLSATGSFTVGGQSVTQTAGSGSFTATEAIRYGKSQVGLKTPEWIDSTDEDHPNTYLISTNGRVNSSTGAANEAQTYLTPTEAITLGQNSVSASFTLATPPSGTATDTLTSGATYALNLVKNGSAVAQHYYAVPSGGTTGVKYVVSSNGEPIMAWNGLTLYGRLYPNTDVTTGGSDQLGRTMVTYNGRSAYVSASNISTTKGSTNYVGRIGWTDEGSDAFARTVDSLSKVTLGSSDTTESTHNVTVTYSDGTIVQNGAQITIDASAISGGGGANLGHRRFTTNNTYYASSYGLDGFSSVEVAVSGGSSGSGGVSGVSRYAQSDESSDFSDWTFNDTKTQTQKYAFYKIAANDGTTFNFGVDASAVYTAGKADGVALQENRTITYSSTGTKTLYPSSGWDAMKKATIIIDVPQSSANLGEKSISKNGTYYSSGDGFDGYKKVTVSVSQATPTISVGSLRSGSAPNRNKYVTVAKGSTNYVIITASAGGSSSTYQLEIRAGT